MAPRTGWTGHPYPLLIRGVGNIFEKKNSGGIGWVIGTALRWVDGEEATD
jgi:hypothetical protein